MNEILRRVWYLGRRSQFDQELDDEILFHLETRAEELQREGIANDAALDQARREFGSRARMSEETRGAWQFHWVEDLWADLRYAMRAFRRNPAFALTAIACLVLGILPNTVLFNVAASALLSPPSVRDPKSVYGVILGGTTSTPMREYRFVRDAKPIDGLVGMNVGSVNWRHEEKAEPLDAARVTDHFFEVTDIPLAMGRPIQPGETDVVVVSHPFWKHHLEGDPQVLGRRLDLDGRVYTIAGVLPSNHRSVFAFGMSVDVYVPVPSDNWSVWLYARLPVGMTPQAATDRVVAAGKELDRVYPDPNHRYAENVFFYQPYGVNFLKLGEEVGIPVVAYLAMLTIVVGLVLLMACANVSGLLLARASARTEELAIRCSLGAARGRIVRQLMAESLLLVLGATLAGLLLTLLLSSLLTNAFDGSFVIQPDWRLLCDSIAIGVIATFACGIMPALSSTRSGINTALKRSARNGRWTLRGALVIGQLAVSVVLLCAALLFIRNLMRASNMNPGFDLEHTVRASVHLIPERYSQPKRRMLIDSALERLRAAPGIESASIASLVPLVQMELSGGQHWTTDLGSPVAVLDTRENDVGTDYFRTMQIPILEGREFLPSDREGSPQVVILNQTMARRLFGTLNPVGHVIRVDMKDPLQIVGLARDSKYWTLGEENKDAYYQPYSQGAPSPNKNASDLDFLIRASGTAGSVVSSVNKVLGQLDSTAALDTKPMRENLDKAMAPSQLGAGVLGAMGLLGLFLASVGLYGVLQYAVSRRTREIGLRVALGATPANVLRLVVGESAVLVGGGIAIGLGIALFAVRPLSMFLIADVRPTVATNFVAVAAALCLVAALATISPTLRALRADPMTALRHE